MLLAAVQHVKETHGDVKRVWGKLYGQEKNLHLSIARITGSARYRGLPGGAWRHPAQSGLL